MKATFRALRINPFTASVLLGRGDVVAEIVRRPAASRCFRFWCGNRHGLGAAKVRTAGAAEIRRPKPEGRKKAETRNPKRVWGYRGNRRVDYAEGPLTPALSLSEG